MRPIDSFLHLLWGAKTSALFDIWTIEHTLSGISVGSAVLAQNHKRLRKALGHDHDWHSWYFAIIGVLFCAYFWEVIEHYLEAGIAGPRVTYWFQGVEFWGNRIITDPLMLVIGYCIARKYRFLVIPARIASITWMLVHVFIFPHCMYLQEILGL